LKVFQHGLALGLWWSNDATKQSQVSQPLTIMATKRRVRPKSHILFEQKQGMEHHTIF
jgi:hypothetical protein